MKEENKNNDPNNKKNIQIWVFEKQTPGTTIDVKALEREIQESSLE